MKKYQYGVQVHIEGDMLSTLVNEHKSLCFQIYIHDGSGPTAEIITAAVGAPSYSTVTTFQWNKVYAIRATSPGEGTGADNNKTDILPITYKDSFVLSSWASYNVEHDCNVAPMNGFAFQPAMQASCVTYLTDYSFLGASPYQAPIYMSPNPVGGGSIKNLVPIDRACVFFDKGYAGSGTGIYTGNKPLSRDVFLDDEVKKKAIKLTNGGYWIETDWDIY